MALKKGYSVTVGVTDLAYLLAAFEDMNMCSITVSFTPIQRSGKADILMQVSAYTKTNVDAEPVRLACESFDLARGNFLSLEAAFVHGLYKLDAQLDEQGHTQAHHK